MRKHVTSNGFAPTFNPDLFMSPLSLFPFLPHHRRNAAATSPGTFSYSSPSPSLPPCFPSFLPYLIDRSLPPSLPPSLSSRCFRMNLPCRKRVGKRRKTGRTGGLADPRPIIDLIIEQADPRLYTELYMQVGGEGGREGGRDRGRTYEARPYAHIF